MPRPFFIRHRAVRGGAVALIASLGLSTLGGAQPASPERGIVTIAASPQRPGDPEKGLEYLLYGDYIGSGFPYDLIVRLSGEPSGSNRLGRRGRSAGVGVGQNVFAMPNGVEVIAGANCLACHASMLRGELVIGLGNSLADWTDEGGGPGFGPIRALAASMYERGAPELSSLNQFLRGLEALDGKTAAPFRGVNPAFRLEEVSAAHRRPADLSWSPERLYSYAPIVMASDVPAWWLLKKKHALYYNGMGRGDFSKLIEQITVVGVEDKSDLERIDRSMPDVLAYLRTLEPPAYPGEIDAGLAGEGEAVFLQNCARCHGTYGEAWTYPNKLVPVKVVGTDPVYAQFLLRSRLWRWFNESWFATTEPRAEAKPTMAYIAPPLDGVWATAPYLHNGSVPTLDVLLESSRRPTYWRRSFRSEDYDLGRVGWIYEAVPAARDSATYDTTRPGYGNMGHTFGDDLSADERRALIEYLKTV